VIAAPADCSEDDRNSKPAKEPARGDPRRIVIDAQIATSQLKSMHAQSLPRNEVQRRESCRGDALSLEILGKGQCLFLRHPLYRTLAVEVADFDEVVVEQGDLPDPLRTSVGHLRDDSPEPTHSTWLREKIVVKAGNQPLAILGSGIAVPSSSIDVVSR